MRNANKSPKTPYFVSGEVSGKVIGNPYSGPGHHHKLISSTDCYRPITIPRFNEIG